MVGFAGLILSGCGYIVVVHVQELERHEAHVPRANFNVK